MGVISGCDKLDKAGIANPRTTDSRNDIVAVLVIEIVIPVRRLKVQAVILACLD